MNHLQKFKLLVATSLSVLTLASATPAYAIDLFGACGNECTSLKRENDLDYTKPNRLWTIVGFALQILGGIAVVIIVIGGIRYSSSNGDPSRVKAAKDTIMYAVIGLVVALLATGIVSLVNTYF